jgi:hypothetical protein
MSVGAYATIRADEYPITYLDDGGVEDADAGEALAQPCMKLHEK